MNSTKVLFMFTNDFRIDDNWTYTKAKQRGEIVPIVIVKKQPNPRMQQFLEECIIDLNNQCNGKLQVYRNQTEVQALEKASNDKITELFYNQDPTSNPNMFNDISKWCKKNNIIQHVGKRDNTLLDFTQLTRPYKVFSNFYNTFIDFVVKIKPLTSSTVKSQGSRLKAINILKSIDSKFADYENTRDFFSKPTTHLSVYLNFGCVSMREVCQAFRNNQSLLKELMWREFYAQIVYFFPNLHKKDAFYPNRDKWGSMYSISKFNKWKKGQTGVPLVDASMRCLNQTGYLHNRARMIVASYLVKDLNIDWRMGEEYFKSQLLDYNFASNNGGWQFISGTGASSMMQTRKFSPWIQAKKFDPDCIFIKKYMPELKNIDNATILNSINNIQKRI